MDTAVIQPVGSKDGSRRHPSRWSRTVVVAACAAALLLSGAVTWRALRAADQPVIDPTHTVAVAAERLDGLRTVVLAAGLAVALLWLMTTVWRRSARRAGERQLALAMEATSDGLWDWNVPRGTVFWSPRCYEMLGYAPNAFAVTPDRLRELIHPDDHGPTRTRMERQLAEGDGSLVLEFRCRSATGEWRWIMARGKPVRRDAAGRPVRVVGTHVDITDRKRVEAELHRRQREIEDANAQLERTIARANAMAVEADAANQAKSAFLANMSHEIRTPMTAILGYIEIIHDQCPRRCEFGSDGVPDCVDTVKRNGQHLLHVINDVLDISKIEAGRLPVEQVRCSPVDALRSVRTLLGSRAQAKNLALGCRFEGPIPETITSDPVRLQQILVNLVGNAIKFTEMGTVDVIGRLTGAETERAQLCFEVRDTGIGISPADLQVLFRPFMQADASLTRRFGGTGLGLAISKRLAILLGGDLEATSELGTGSTFRLTIATGDLAGVTMLHRPDLTQAKSRPEQRPASPALPDLTGLRVLLVEDGPDNQKLLAAILRKAGATVELAENGKVGMEAALAAADAGAPFDVVLMDMQMPEMDGYEATTRLRATGYTGPIIALTAHALEYDRDKCLGAGCDEYAAKPVNRRQLLELVERHAHTLGESPTRLTNPPAAATDTARVAPPLGTSD